MKGKRAAPTHTSSIFVRVSLLPVFTFISFYFPEGHGNFSFEMGLYRNSEYSSPYEVSEYPVSVDPFGQLYCEAKLDTSDSGLVLLADTCLATPSMDPTHSVHYTFIKDG